MVTSLKRNILISIFIFHNFFSFRFCFTHKASGLMLAGRLELYPLLMVLSRSFWKSES